MKKFVIVILASLVLAGLGHCSACHMPRNGFGAEITDQNYDGALIDNWYAPALNAKQPGPIQWNETLLYNYLRAGQSDYQGVAIGSMEEVVHEGLALASDSDIRALSVYIKSLSGAANSTSNENDETESNAALAKRLITAANRRNATADDEHSEQLYRAACAACHYNSADNPKALRAELSLNSAVTADNPTNLLRITLEGIAVDKVTPGLVMPAFNMFSDGDVIALAQFLRVRAN
jgi:mono/diheme cytochrome c family protein